MTGFTEEIATERIKLYEKYVQDEFTREGYLKELRALMEGENRTPEDLATILIDIGHALGSSKNKDAEAKAVFETALKCHPISERVKAGALTGISMALASLEQYDEAEAIAREALEINQFEISSIEPTNKVEAFFEFRAVAMEALAKKVIEGCHHFKLKNKYENSNNSK